MRRIDRERLFKLSFARPRKRSARAPNRVFDGGEGLTCQNLDRQIAIFPDVRSIGRLEFSRSWTLLAPHVLTGASPPPRKVRPARMKTVILAGGLGSRLGEETAVRPKPMVEIGGRPILWHIMKIYSAHGLNDFIVCLGYKGYLIKEYFSNYFLHMSDVTIDLTKNSIETHQNSAEPWRITLIDTGADTMTGGRLKAMRPYLDRGRAVLLHLRRRRGGHRHRQARSPSTRATAKRRHLDRRRPSGPLWGHGVRRGFRHPLP